MQGEGKVGGLIQAEVKVPRLAADRNVGYELHYHIEALEVIIDIQIL